MSLPEPGETLPDFTLATTDGGARVHLAEHCAGTPGLVAFFKASCVTSRMSLPFIERLHHNYPALAVLGISQDNAEETAQFAADTGVTFPVVLDTDWRVSVAYDLFTVPTVFLVDARGAVSRVNMGWNSEQYAALSDEIAALLGTSPVSLWRDGDKVPPFKPG
jgi:peroxiredoxin